MRLTIPQRVFLESLREKTDDGCWAWCECFRGEWRTAKSLERRGLVEIMPGDELQEGLFEARLADKKEAYVRKEKNEIYHRNTR